ncbi:MAG: histone deacetylase family protein [Hyphomicrobiales bacterium]
MKAVFDERQYDHAPSRFLSRGAIVPYPEAPERATLLLAGARAAGLAVVAPDAFDPASLKSVHTARYLRYLETAHAEWSRLPNAGPEVTASVRPVEKPAQYPKDIMGKAGWHMMDFSCVLLQSSHQAILASAASAATAARLVLDGERAAYALARPPGHHAYADRGSGFCYVNNSALAAETLRGRHDRVAILDIDVHHGNGTQGIFYARPDVLTVSIHADPAAYYPYFYGHAVETGRGAGRGFNLNLPVPVKSGDTVWLSTLDKALTRIATYRPGALVLALGLDAHEADPLAGGAVTRDGFKAMAKLISRLNLPTVIVQEGGYLTDFLSGNLTAFLESFGA